MDTSIETAEFLNNSPSVSGRWWRLRAADDRLVSAIMQMHDLPEVIARILVQRNIKPEEVESFLSPTLRRDMPDPASFKDMEKAAERIADAVINKHKIAVFGDYDVDGATSAAMIIRYFRSLGTDVRLYVPDRLSEGYGPNPQAMRTLASEGMVLCIAVDCGTTAFSALEEAAKLGLDVVVFDHHIADASLPPAYAIVNPNRLDESTTYRNLAAVGVTFLAIAAVNRCLRQRSFFSGSVKEPDILQFLDLVTVGTICDVSLLTGFNRTLVHQGMKVLGRRSNVGLAALADVASLSAPPNSYNVGFALGPRINAGGRVGACDLSTRLLVSDDYAEALVMAKDMDASNSHRKGIEAEMLLQAKMKAEELIEKGSCCLTVAREGWHQGVIGIVAGRLKETFRLPSIVISMDSDSGIGKASGRSVKGVNLGELVTLARKEGLIVSGGGHAMAAGFAVATNRVGELAEFFNEHTRKKHAEIVAASGMEIEAVLSVNALNLELASKLEKLGPFGSGNPQPRFMLDGVRIVRAGIVGENHVRCIISGMGGSSVQAIAFRAKDTPLGKALLSNGGTPLHIAGSLKAEHWNGTTRVQFVIDDASMI